MPLRPTPRLPTDHPPAVTPMGCIEILSVVSNPVYLERALRALLLSARLAGAPYVCHYARPHAYPLTSPPPPLHELHRTPERRIQPHRTATFPTDQPIHQHLTFPGTPSQAACCIRSRRTHTLTASPLNHPADSFHSNPFNSNPIQPNPTHLKPMESQPSQANPICLQFVA